MPSSMPLGHDEARHADRCHERPGDACWPKASRSRTSSRVRRWGWPAARRSTGTPIGASRRARGRPAARSPDLEDERLVGAQIDDVPAAGAGPVGVDDIADIEALPLVDHVVGAVDVEAQEVLEEVVGVEAAPVGAELDDPGPHLRGAASIVMARVTWSAGSATRSSPGSGSASSSSVVPQRSCHGFTQRRQPSRACTCEGRGTATAFVFIGSATAFVARMLHGKCRGSTGRRPPATGLEGRASPPSAAPVSPPGWRGRGRSARPGGLPPGRVSPPWSFHGSGWAVAWTRRRRRGAAAVAAYMARPVQASPSALIAVDRWLPGPPRSGRGGQDRRRGRPRRVPAGRSEWPALHLTQRKSGVSAETGGLAGRPDPSHQRPPPQVGQSPSLAPSDRRLERANGAPPSTAPCRGRSADETGSWSDSDRRSLRRHRHQGVGVCRRHRCPLARSGPRSLPGAVVACHVGR